MATTSAKPVTPFSVLETVPPPTSITKVHTRGEYVQESLRPKDCASEAANFVVSHSNANRAAARRTLDVFFNSTLADCCMYDEESMAKAKAAVRIITSPANLISHPHIWHRDGNCFPVNIGHINSRYSMTMVGPPTDVLFEDIPVDDAVSRWYDRRAVAILEAQRTRPLSTGQIYRFTIGRSDSPVHSTPVFTTDRIFVSVVYYQDS
ncbi:hypothetical protein EG329_012391 [Mollisiaceae sp. DMI_Dod_QoI]|nr:hypothetical protein EG329_012391 [Helotiales sp. DMI_Dod_QoI]